MKELRPAIIHLHERGLTAREIARRLDIPRKTVDYAIQRFKETGSNENRKGQGLKKTARNAKNVRRAKGMLQRNPTTKANSSRKLATKLQISPMSAYRILRKDLGLMPFKLKKRQKLTAEAKKKRFDRSWELLRRFSGGKHELIIFSDEKLFDIEQVGSNGLFQHDSFQSFNPQNDRIWSAKAPETEKRLVDRVQKAKSVMVWAAISRRGKTPLVFVDQGIKINRNVYMNMVRDHLLDWANETFDGEKWCFQQDSAPGHKANETQEMLSNECPDFITRDEWPPNSPDLNPLDYSMWAILEEKACAKPHTTVESLKRALKKAWNEITVNTLEKMVDNFPKRLKACVEANGGYFE